MRNALLVALLSCSIACSSASFVSEDPDASDAAASPETDPPTDASTDAPAESEPSAPDLVKTADGRVHGALHLRSREFLGIPFAAPPIGPRRWKAPEAAIPWIDVRDATKFGHHCPQPKTFLTPPNTTPDEDCLVLNVWTPLPVPTKAPVMVWIHGGSAIVGAGSDPGYAGRNLAERSGTIVVTLNYRLGPLGFVAHPKLGSTGNQGFLDQQMALRWVQAKVAAFGGDPGNVTIFGESAGSMSVCSQLTIPSSKGLFHRAIMESGACPERLPSLEEGELQTNGIAKTLGCDPGGDFDSCMRSKTYDEIIKATPTSAEFGSGASFGGVLDGTTFAVTPYASLKAGTFHKVPVMIGTNHDEGTMFVLDKLFMWEAEYTKLITSYFGADASAVLARYPAKAYASPATALARVVGDFAFICPARRDARAISAAGTKTFLYHFTRKPASTPIAFLGSYHGAEIPFVFHNPPGSPPLFASDEDALSWSMVGYWTRFATAGDPNGAGSVTWPAYDKSDRHLGFDLDIAAGSSLFRDACDFADGITP